MSLTSTQQLFAVRLLLEMQKSLRICRLLILMFMSEYFLGVYCLGQLMIHTREKDESCGILGKGDTRVQDVTISNTTNKNQNKSFECFENSTSFNQNCYDFYFH